MVSSIHTIYHLKSVHFSVKTHTHTHNILHYPTDRHPWQRITKKKLQPTAFSDTTENFVEILLNLKKNVDSYRMPKGKAHCIEPFENIYTQ